MADPNNPNACVADSRAFARVLSFPADDSIHDYSMTIHLQTYSRGNPREPPKLFPGDNITLPLPMSGIEDNTNLQYDEVPLGLVGGILGTLSSTDSGASKVKAGVLAGERFYAKSTAGALGDLAGNVLSQAGLNTMAQAATDIGNAAGAAIDQASGLASNPNLSLSFQGVKLREHNFSWRFIAKSDAESATLTDIVQTLKRNALPRKVYGASLTLAYPSIAFLEFKPAGLIPISKFGCFLENINIRYDGEGHPAFFRKTNNPVIIDISMTFKERAILTSEDYGGSSDYTFFGDLSQGIQQKWNDGIKELGIKKE
jgi:hypothetical protein